MRRLRRAQRKHARKRNKLKERAFAVGAAATITFAAGGGLNKALAHSGDERAHQLPVTRDADSDLLSNLEELTIGYRPFRSDQNRNRILDGVELAKRCAAVINELPEYNVIDSNYGQPAHTYKLVYLLRGAERCDICGEEYNMGGWLIINPKLKLLYPHANDPLDGEFLPRLAVHYMEHGSFDCFGRIGTGPWHTGRVNVQRLTRVLELRFPYEPDDHQLPLDYPDPCNPSRTLVPHTDDLDGDLMADTEELDVRFNLYDPDQNHNLAPDGIEFAGQCAAVIKSLPVEGVDPIPEGQVYRQCWFQRGLELCDICGRSVNMGFWRIINPRLGLSIDLYDITCHYMSHGSFSYSGLWVDPPNDPFHCGRVKIALLARILGMPRHCRHLGTLRLPADLNEEGNVDFKDIAGLADKWLKCTDPADPRCDGL
ncbi:MAG: hypothetical protein ACYTEQ_11050 [Planctomycetota bacterium]|jgi:hypothetical protein